MLCSVDPASFPLSKLEEVPASLGSDGSAPPWRRTREPKALTALCLHTLQLLPTIHLPSRLRVTAQLGNHVANNKKWRRGGGEKKEQKKQKKACGGIKQMPAVMGLGRSNACTASWCGTGSRWDCMESSVGLVEIEEM